MSKMPYKSTAYMISESEIRYAMENTGSNHAAALFLKVNYRTYHKYATMYYDKETGKTLWDLQKNRGGKRVVKKHSRTLAKVEDIFVGSHPNYPYSKLKARLIQEGIFGDQCNICNYHSLRRADLQTPTLLAFKNGNERDRRKENMEIVCLNCYFLYYGDLMIKKQRVQLEKNKPEIAPTDVQVETKVEYHGIKVQRASGFEY